MKPCCVLPNTPLRLVSGVGRQEQPGRGAGRGTARQHEGWARDGAIFGGSIEEMEGKALGTPAVVTRAQGCLKRQELVH